MVCGPGFDSQRLHFARPDLGCAAQLSRDLQSHHKPDQYPLTLKVGNYRITNAKAGKSLFHLSAISVKRMRERARCSS